MTTPFDQDAQRKYLAEHGLYDPMDEHSSCGVGFIASTDGRARRDVVSKGIDALKVLFHRGAVDADGQTGDGAGIHVEIPQSFFHEHVERTGHHPDHDTMIAVGQVFLPRTDMTEQEACRTVVEAEILKFGYKIYGWRQVPVNTAVIGDKARSTRPEIEQIMIAGKQGESEAEYERNLYVIRRRIEKRVIERQLSGFYICSLSCRSIIYKGLFLAEQLSVFYPDLLDKRFESRFAIYHQRYSTNTFPEWWLAQPFRSLAHNGEINTIRGNKNWMKVHEIKMAANAFDEHSEDIKPVIPVGASDSAALDAVFELLVQGGRDAPMVKTMLIPESWSKKSTMPEEWRHMYAHLNSVMEPWDGPAAIAATDGKWIIGGMDRNGLRPMRYTLTRDGLLIVGSETGMVVVPETNVAERGRLGPGQMVAVDLENGGFFHDAEIKNQLASEAPYKNWVETFHRWDDLRSAEDVETKTYSRDELRKRQVAASITMEDLELILHPQAEDAKEAIGSMGDDTPLAVISNKRRNLGHFFRQNFSQVTNPPIDPLREHRVMSLKTRFGNFANVLDKEANQTGVLVIDSPVVTNNEWSILQRHFSDSATVIDCTFSVDGGESALSEAMRRIREEAEAAVRAGKGQLFITDEFVTPERCAIPMIIATAAIHSHLMNHGLRTFSSVNVRAAEAFDTHYFAVLIGGGATTVNAYLAQESIADRQSRGLFGDLSLQQCVDRHREAINQGLLKIMSKMGISVVSSYRGGYNFEAVGLSRALVAELFPGMPSKISGMGVPGIQIGALEQHEKAFAEDVIALPVGGFYKYRQNGEAHAFDGRLIHMLQSAVSNDSYSQYLAYSEGLQSLPPINLRDLMEIGKLRKTDVSIDEVQSITEIRKRFLTPGMSMGALSPEAHETLTIAMNRVGAKSVSGEGGEDPARYKPRENGDNANSPIKQIASGRFGVTAEYLNACEELEIKVAQGAKPGEGGQLPGFKVTEMIARLRHSTPGVTLISPPPHHDIYSIEDLAQLIYDLKQINPRAKVCVKLVSAAGIGTIAAGVAKAHADTILISGNNGGTGASPQTSIKYAGTPWEMGLAEVNQVLTLNGLRHRVKLRTDGGIKSGRDVVIAALLGAEEFGVGTTSLIAMGCIMVRQCHSNTCPVGICTQDDKLRDKFAGTPEQIVNLFSFIAEETREILGSIGAKDLNEIIGRTDLLRQVSRGADHLDDLDLNPLLVRVHSADGARYCQLEGRNEVDDTLDAQMLKDAPAVFSHGEKMQLTYTARNTMRAIGTRFSSHITRKFGMKGLAPGHVTVRLRGSAGQALGAFTVQGLRLEVFGDSNDYVGKGLSGATIVVRPPTSSTLPSEDNTIIGNTCLYGATAGQLFAAGQAGERFGVRNSGATTVIEGCGANGCEYMTGGVAAILGSVGDNFGAGMTGGMAFIFDKDNTFEEHVNDETVVFDRIRSAHWEAEFKALVEAHLKATSSLHAKRLLADWETTLSHVWQVCPKEMVKRLDNPLVEEAA